MTLRVRSFKRYVYSAFKSSRTSNFRSGLSSLIACFKVFKRRQTKGTPSQSTTSYCLFDNNSDSKEPEVVHGYDVRMRRSKTPIEHIQSITEQDKKQRPVTVKTKKLDDSQHVQNWSFRSSPFNTIIGNWINCTPGCRINIKDSRKSARRFASSPGDKWRRMFPTHPVASSSAHVHLYSTHNLVLSLLVIVFKA